MLLNEKVTVLFFIRPKKKMYDKILNSNFKERNLDNHYYQNNDK